MDLFRQMIDAATIEFLGDGCRDRSVYWTHDRRVATLLRNINREPSADNQGSAISTQSQSTGHAIGESDILPPVLRQNVKDIGTNIETRDNQTSRSIQGKLDPFSRCLNRRNLMPIIAHSIQRIIKKITGKFIIRAAMPYSRRIMTTDDRL